MRIGILYIHMDRGFSRMPYAPSPFIGRPLNPAPSLDVRGGDPPRRIQAIQAGGRHQVQGHSGDALRERLLRGTLQDLCTIGLGVSGGVGCRVRCSGFRVHPSRCQGPERLPEGTNMTCWLLKASSPFRVTTATCRYN